MFDWLRNKFNNMASNSEMFDTYIKYFQLQNKRIKCTRRGVNILDSAGNAIESYKTWEDLNSVYKQFPSNETQSPKENLTLEYTKVYCWGSADSYKAKKLAQKLLGNSTKVCFDNPQNIYYVDRHSCLVQTKNELIIDLITGSDEWTEYRYEPIQLSRKDIVDRFGFESVDDFVIVD